MLRTHIVHTVFRGGRWVSPSFPGTQVTLGGPQSRVGPSPEGKQSACVTIRERNSGWVRNGGLIQRSGTSGEVGGPAVIRHRCVPSVRNGSRELGGVLGSQ